MGRTTFYSRNYVDWPPIPVSAVTNPDSWYWKEQAATVAKKLSQKMGLEAYCAWIDSLPDGFSWAELHDYCQAKLDELAASGLVGDHPYSQDSTQIDSCHRISGGKND
jgi:hypothetical protein